MQHIFIAPTKISSPRWQQAFANIVHLEHLPLRLPEESMVWVYLHNKSSFDDIALSARDNKVIALTAQESAQEARIALEQGASGYLHYFAVPELLVQVASVVNSGGLWLGSELMRQLITATAKQLPPSPKADLSILTSRERLVAEAIAAGKSNKEAARDLAITERTVKAHLGAVFTKLGVRDRLQLVLLLSGKKS
jgi:DNA-binding NarL/FixJ family response regulator